jgi:hypothetical protein
VACSGFSALDNLHKRPRSQLVQRQAGERADLVLTNGPAVERAQEEIQQSLSRGRVVEHRARERGLGGLPDQIEQSLRCSVQAFQEERIDGRVARDQLRGVQIPALIEGVGERVADVVVMQPPRASECANNRFEVTNTRLLGQLTTVCP